MNVEGVRLATKLARVVAGIGCSRPLDQESALLRDDRVVLLLEDVFHVLFFHFAFVAHEFEP